LILGLKQNMSLFQDCWRKYGQQKIVKYLKIILIS